MVLGTIPNFKKIFVNLNAPSLKADLFRGRISLDEYDSHMDELMSLVKDISSEISLLRNEITNNRKDILYLQDDKIKHDNDIISSKVGVAHCSDRIKEYTDDNHLHSKTIKNIRQGQVQAKQDIQDLRKAVSTRDLKISATGPYHIKSPWISHDVESWPLIKTSNENNFSLE